MASIVLNNVVIDFPIYGVQPLLRKALFARLADLGIRIANLGRNRDGAQKRLVIRALDTFSLTLNHGDHVGLIGPNGAGKSTLLRVLAGIYAPTHGHIEIEGRISPLFSTSPGLDMDDTGYENIYTCGLFLGMSRKEIEAKLSDIAAFSELGDYLGLPVRTYSTGMLVRLGFAVATAIEPEILLLDEGLGAGDARFAKRARERVDKLIRRSSILVLASHSDELIKQMCNRALLLDHGKLIADGTPNEVIAEYHARLALPQTPQLTLSDGGRAS